MDYKKKVIRIPPFYKSVFESIKDEEVIIARPISNILYKVNRYSELVEIISYKSINLENAINIKNTFDIYKYLKDRAIEVTVDINSIKYRVRVVDIDNAWWVSLQGCKVLKVFDIFDGLKLYHQSNNHFFFDKKQKFIAELYKELINGGNCTRIIEKYNSILKLPYGISISKEELLAELNR
ncbi:MAG: hypothetical protein ACE5KT_02850 [Methanosarcinales archaeon]